MRKLPCNITYYCFCKFYTHLFFKSIKPSYIKYYKSLFKVFVIF